MEEEEEEEEEGLREVNHMEESLREMDMAYRLAQHRSLERENSEWLRGPSPTAGKVNGIHLHLSPTKSTDDPSARWTRLGPELHPEDAFLGYSGRPGGLLAADDVSLTREPSEDSEEELHHHHHQQHPHPQHQQQHPQQHQQQQQQARLEPSWVPGVPVRPLGMERARLNLSLLEQAMLLQSEQRQALHYAYKDMDRFLLEQMSGERRHQRMMEMNAARAAFHGCKGAVPAPTVSPSRAASSEVSPLVPL